MRYREILNEDAVADIDDHILAVKMADGVKRYFRTKVYEQPDMAPRYEEVGAQDLYVFRGHLFGWTGPYAQQAFAVEFDRPAIGGRLACKPDGTGPYTVILRVPLTMGEFDELASLIPYEKSVGTVLVHEISHMIAYANGKSGDLYNNGYVDLKSGKAGYYNHPVETQAFFHNFADALLRFLARCKVDRSADSIINDAKINGISTDFWKTWENALKGQPTEQVKRFVALMRKGTRRRALSRFYALHARAVEILKKAEAQAA